MNRDELIHATTYKMIHTTPQVPHVTYTHPLAGWLAGRLTIHHVPLGSSFFISAPARNSGWPSMPPPRPEWQLTTQMRKQSGQLLGGRLLGELGKGSLSSCLEWSTSREGGLWQCVIVKGPASQGVRGGKTHHLWWHMETFVQSGMSCCCCFFRQKFLNLTDSVTYIPLP